eukprot:scaffold12311_cov56-Phaeocystis_antarctica.AAC.5
MLLLHEAGEGGEVAILRRLANSLHRLRGAAIRPQRIARARGRGACVWRGGRGGQVEAAVAQHAHRGYATPTMAILTMTILTIVATPTVAILTMAGGGGSGYAYLLTHTWARDVHPVGRGSRTAQCQRRA